jgi:hypothetical protein
MTVESLANLLLGVLLVALALPLLLALASRVLGESRTERVIAALARYGTPALLGVVGGGLAVSWAVTKGPLTERAQRAVDEAYESGREAGTAAGREEAGLAAKELERRLEKRTAELCEVYSKRIAALQEENRELERKVEMQSEARAILEAEVRKLRSSR